jgi:arylsulfatase A-like enzyme
VLLGNHGGSGELNVPFIVAGGLPDLRPLPEQMTVSLADVAPTVAAILGVRSPERLGGSSVPAGSAGRVLPLLRAVTAGAP